MNKLPTQCPMCQSELEVTGLYCPHCDTSIRGHFAPTANPFNVLNQEQMHFLMTFIRCEGRFNRMEEELNLSYPTLRNRLQDSLRLLGFDPKADEPVNFKPADRMRILEALASGEIRPYKAKAQLDGKKTE